MIPARDQDTDTAEKGLEPSVVGPQDDVSALPQGKETQHETGTPTRRYVPHQRRSTPEPKYQAFADRLRDAMMRGGLTASEVARRVWGTSKDKRGYPVARNRDRIGAYLSGNSFPEPENLAKLADAIGASIDELAPMSAAESSEPPKLRTRSILPEPMPGSLHLIPVAGKIRIRGTIDVVVDINRVQDIVDLLMKPEPEPETDQPELGSIINNGTDP